MPAYGLRERRRAGAWSDPQNPLHRISLIRAGAYRGAFVRIPVPGGTASEPECATFNYAAYGGRKGAIAAAQAWRDQRGRELWGEMWPDLPRFVGEGPHFSLSRANSTGVTGVWCQEKLSLAGTPLRHFIALWQQKRPDGSRYTARRQFSVNRYGVAGALELAYEARRSALEAQGYLLPPRPDFAHLPFVAETERRIAEGRLPQPKEAPRPAVSARRRGAKEPATDPALVEEALAAAGLAPRARRRRRR